MQKLVLDTNVWVSAIIADGQPRRLLRKAIAGEFTVATSPELLRELSGVLRRPKFRMSESDVQLAITAVTELCQVVLTVANVHVVKEDPDDDMVLNAALDARAELIVSGDKHLLALKNYAGIPIVTVAHVLAKA